MEEIWNLLVIGYWVVEGITIVLILVQLIIKSKLILIYNLKYGE